MREIVVLLSLLMAPLAKANQLHCVAQAVYHESGGEPERCQRMVADVVLNRVKHRGYPSTACGVVYQRSQFSWTKHKPRVSDRAAWQRSVSIARQQMLGTRTTHAIYFTRGTRFGPVVDSCGKHIFMREV